MRRRKTLLRNGRLLLDGSFQLCDVRIEGSTISAIETGLRPSKDDIVVALDGLCVAPGLINSHDHLEFNLFPHIGNPPYRNYVDWSEDLQTSYRTEIERVLSVPLTYRLLWGAYKNLFSGVTTVVHHNRYYWQFRYGFPVGVYHPYQWIHSLKLEKRSLESLVAAHSSKCFIHLAEGIDAEARSELGEYLSLGGVLHRTVLIHGIALTDEDIERLKGSDAALVWCPGSNTFLFGVTAPVEKMFGKFPILLGTDSTLTGPPSLFEEMRTARALKHLSSQAVVELVTSVPSRYLSMNEGEIRVGAQANLLAFDAHDRDPFDALVELSTEDICALWRNGITVVGDPDFRSVNQGFRTSSIFEVRGRKKFVVGDFGRLKAAVKHYSPDLRLPPIVPDSTIDAATAAVV